MDKLPAKSLLELNMFYSLRKKIRENHFNRKTRTVFDRVRVELDSNAGFILVTQLQETDIQMYLLALGSFTRFLVPKHVIIVSDGISEKGIGQLQHCVPDITILDIDTVRDSRVPRGGCWERLTTIINYVEENYVIQLDADTFTLNIPNEVKSCIGSSRPFTLVANSNSKLMTMKEIGELVKDWPQDHVQVLSEKALGRLQGNESRKYVRGCAAFTGFPKGSVTFSELVKFSDEMARELGAEKWGEWGGEQVASNYLIASLENASLLPFDAYPFYNGENTLDEETVRLCHFIGSYRFDRGVYLNLCRQYLSSIANGKAA